MPSKLFLPHVYKRIKLLHFLNSFERCNEKSKCMTLTEHSYNLSTYGFNEIAGVGGVKTEHLMFILILFKKYNFYMSYSTYEVANSVKINKHVTYTCF